MTESDLGICSAPLKNTPYFPSPPHLHEWNCSFHLLFFKNRKSPREPQGALKEAALSFQGMRERKGKRKWNEKLWSWAYFSLKMSQKPSQFRGHSQVVNISLTSQMLVLIYQMDMKLLKLTSVFVLCLIPSGFLTFLGGFKVFYEAAIQFHS